MHPVDSLPISAIVDLVNEYSDETRRVAGETNEPYAVLDALEPFDADTSELVALADELHDVFADALSASDRLNRLTERRRLRHRLTADGRLVWMRPESVSALAAAVVAVLVDFVADAGPDRLGACKAHACVDIFVDTSPAKSRSYCSPQCNSRARVARWRASHREDASMNHYLEAP